MRPALFVSLLVLGCSLGPPPAITPPRAPRCADRRAFLGTWVHDTVSMELRPDGTIVRGGPPDGGFRFRTPGQVVIDIGSAHEEHTYGLLTGAQLLDIDPDGHFVVWTRISMLPDFPAGCFDIHGSVVGDWTDGLSSESFLADGSYVRGETRGNWSTPEPGYLDVAVGLRVWRYRVAITGDDTLLSALDGPVLGDDPRGASLVEARIR